MARGNLLAALQPYRLWWTLYVLLLSAYLEGNGRGNVFLINTEISACAHRVSLTRDLRRGDLVDSPVTPGGDCGVRSPGQ